MLALHPAGDMVAGRRTALAGLVLANVVPLVGVSLFDWPLHALLVAYWLESAAVGLAFGAKIRRADGEDDPDALPSMSFNDRPVSALIGWDRRRLLGFFAFHYGAFWVVHGVFVLAFPAMFPGMSWADTRIVALATVGLVAYHAISYWTNYLRGREYEHKGPVTLMIEPYRRVLVLHVTILLGAFAIAAMGTPVGALVVMVLAKTVLDLRGHWREHARATGPARPTATAE